MKRLQRLFLCAVLAIFSISLFGQEDNSKDFSYSFSYIPPYLFLSQGDFGFLPAYANFEANIHYKPFDRVSLSSGLGYFRIYDELPEYYIETMIEYGRSHQESVSNFRVPLQANYHIVKSPNKTDCYIKGVFTNEIFTDKLVKYETDGTTSTSRSASYYPSIGLGMGAIFRKHKDVGILLEGTIEKFLRSGNFKNSTFLVFKIGVVI